MLTISTLLICLTPFDQPAYNPLLLTSMDLIIAFQFNLQVVHITGSDNAVADALSRFHYNVVTSLAPHTSVSLFEPP